MKKTIEISGIWLRSIAKNQFEVLAEFNGKWACVIKENFIHDNVVSHIVEPLGIKKASEGNEHRMQVRDIEENKSSALRRRAIENIELKKQVTQLKEENERMEKALLFWSALEEMIEDRKPKAE